jgi:glycosyltransferase involved in cell wall biosynthesis
VPKSVLNQVGVVIIGRNEGGRLVKCFDSIQNRVKEIVYVDSGSTDDSVATSIGRNIHTVELDMAIPFTAARARNEGFNRLNQLHPDLKYVQFIDGDCEVVGGWLHSAVQFLEKSDRVAVVCGRLRERFPAASVYNMLCDIEWDTPVGEARSCGGVAMMRVKAFENLNGYRDDLIAGEEPELCFRLREIGWEIWRLDVEMALHDAAMTEFGQWWKRSTRAGYAFAAGVYLHGRSPEKYWVKETRSAWIWGFLIPLGTISTMYLYGLWALVLLLSYPVQVARLTYAGNRGIRVNFIHAFFLVSGKFPQIFGVLKFFINHIMNTKARLIEYK